SQFRHPPRPTLFPYTTLFRSLEVGDDWTITLSVADGSTVAAQVTNPSGDTATVAPVVTGSGVRISVPLTEGGRYLAVVTVVTDRSEEHTSELQSRENLVCRLL